ncbi:unnamed protein product [Thelazia callipaeda]|uniref:PH domain-containing protein n=1 Tax=Thelazia callipaeda TaxID=103827 RepID=A0A0N5CQ64_THECL|nr:unnamed protein product [Thelazia callipaeda]
MREVDENEENLFDIYISGMEMRPPALKTVTVEKLHNWLKNVKEIIDKLFDSQKEHLFKIRSSPQYVEKLIEALDQKRALESRYAKMKELAIEKRKEAQSSVQKSRQILDEMCAATKVLQKEIEAVISKKYGGRKVNIMGGINAALSAI